MFDITLHAGLDLHNRRLQARFLSRLPKNAEFTGIAGAMALAQAPYIRLDLPLLGAPPQVSERAPFGIDFSSS
jgi:hypothetical protein